MSDRFGVECTQYIIYNLLSKKIITGVMEFHFQFLNDLDFFKVHCSRNQMPVGPSIFLMSIEFIISDVHKHLAGNIQG
jgi:hypothetical protein